MINKSVTVTRHISEERYSHWVVSVPNDLPTESIQELMRNFVENNDLELDEEEFDDEGQLSVDVFDAPALAKPNFILTDTGIVHEESVLPA